MNSRDLDGPGTLVSRLANADENLSPRNSRILKRQSTSIINYFTKATPNISNDIRDIRAFLQSRLEDQGNSLCSFAANRAWYQKDIENLGGAGFAYSRLQNAARLSAAFPTVDLFTPSMVDFYESVDNSQVGKLHKQVEFYALLNLASKGRIVPLVSFSPERQIDYEAAHPAETLENYFNSPLGVVEKAIRTHGFIGIKVHPTSGFVASGNTEFGCLPVEIEKKLTTEQRAARLQAYDHAMERLFWLAISLDVPVLSHGGYTLMSNRGCMAQQDVEQIDWSSSPRHWVRFLSKINGSDEGSAFQKLRDEKRKLRDRQANPPLEIEEPSEEEKLRQHWQAILLGMEDGNSNAPNLLRVSIGHLAGGFEKNINGLHLSGWADYVADNISTPGLYIDASILANLFATTVGGRRFLSKEGRRKLRAYSRRTGMAAKLMYGTDWHMPGVSKLSDIYLDALDDTFSKYPTRIMGGNAARFFGINQPGRVRDRLEHFYTSGFLSLFDDNPDMAALAVDVDQISWWAESLRHHP